MTDEYGIMEIDIRDMSAISAAELQEIVDRVTEDWEYEAWTFDTLSRIEFPACTIGDAEDMVEALKRGLSEDLLVRARLSVGWWIYDEHDEGLVARLRWEADE